MHWVQSAFSVGEQVVTNGGGAIGCALQHCIEPVSLSGRIHRLATVVVLFSSLDSASATWISRKCI